MTKAILKRKIFETDFAIHELVLFLDTHPANQKAIKLLAEFRKKRQELIGIYEDKFEPFVITADDAYTGECWQWLKGPWPWENDFMEA